jgi:hypothetical protein
VAVSGYDDPNCAAEYLYAWFADEGEAFDYAGPFAEDSLNCDTVIVQPENGICCDGVCFPDYGSLPFYTNLEPQDLTCP